MNRILALIIVTIFVVSFGAACDQAGRSIDPCAGGHTRLTVVSWHRKVLGLFLLGMGFVLLGIGARRAYAGVRVSAPRAMGGTGGTCGVRSRFFGIGDEMIAFVARTAVLFTMAVRRRVIRSVEA